MTNWLPSLISALAGLGGAWLGASISRTGQREQQKLESTHRNLVTQRSALADTLTACREVVEATIHLAPRRYEDASVETLRRSFTQRHDQVQIAALNAHRLITVALLTTDDALLVQQLLNIGKLVDKVGGGLEETNGALFPLEPDDNHAQTVAGAYVELIQRARNLKAGCVLLESLGIGLLTGTLADVDRLAHQTKDAQTESGGKRQEMRLLRAVSARLRLSKRTD
jgi:hypothetical protein